MATLISVVAPLAGTEAFWEELEAGNLSANLRLRDLDGESLCHANLADDHSAVAVADEYTRPRAIQDQTSGRQVGLERCLRFLDDKDGIAAVFQDVGDRLPARTIGEGAVDENDIRDGAVTDGC